MEPKPTTRFSYEHPLVCIFITVGSEVASHAAFLMSVPIDFVKVVPKKSGVGSWESEIIRVADPVNWRFGDELKLTTRYFGVEWIRSLTIWFLYQIGIGYFSMHWIPSPTSISRSQEEFPTTIMTTQRSSYPYANRWVVAQCSSATFYVTWS